MCYYKPRWLATDIDQKEISVQPPKVSKYLYRKKNYFTMQEMVSSSGGEKKQNMTLDPR